MCTSEIQMILKCNVEKHFKYAPTSTSSKFLINLTLKMCVNVIESQASKQTLISLFIIHLRHLVRGIIVFEIVFTKSSKKKKGLNSYHASAQALSLGKTGLSSRYLRPF